MNCVIWSSWSWQEQEAERAEGCQGAITLNSLRPTAFSSSPCGCGPQPERMGVHTGLQSLQVQVCPCSIPGALRRNSLFYSTHRTSRTQTELGWLASTACSCLLGQGRVGSCTSSLITKAIIQAEAPLSSSKHFPVNAKTTVWWQQQVPIFLYHNSMKALQRTAVGVQRCRVSQCCACLLSCRSGPCVPGCTLEPRDSFWPTRHKQTAQTTGKHQHLHRSDLPSCFKKCLFITPYIYI